MGRKKHYKKLTFEERKAIEMMYRIEYNRQNRAKRSSSEADDETANKYAFSNRDLL